MYHFRIVPVDRPADGVELPFDEMHRIFDIAEKLQSPLVDILRDEDYAFSCRRFGERGAFWEIFQRSA